MPNPGSGAKILLAEDNPVGALLIRELLRRRGHRIIDVTAGTAAVEAMENDSFDLLLTDIQMPGMDGFLTEPVDPAELEEMFLMLFPSKDGLPQTAAT